MSNVRVTKENLQKLIDLELQDCFETDTGNAILDLRDARARIADLESQRVPSVSAEDAIEYERFVDDTSREFPTADQRAAWWNERLRQKGIGAAPITRGQVLELTKTFVGRDQFHYFKMLRMPEDMADDIMALIEGGEK